MIQMVPVTAKGTRSSTTTTRVSLVLDKALHRAIKQRATASDSTIQEMLASAVRELAHGSRIPADEPRVESRPKNPQREKRWKELEASLRSISLALVELADQDGVKIRPPGYELPEEEEEN